MLIAIRPIARAFEKLQESFTKTNDDLIKLQMPLENLKVTKIGRAMQYATAEHCPYLYKEGGICEMSAFDLTNRYSITKIPRCQSNEELSRLLTLIANNLIMTYLTWRRKGKISYTSTCKRESGMNKEQIFSF